VNPDQPLPDETDLQNLADLVTHRGWHLFKQMVMDEIAHDFEESIIKQLALPDDKVALGRARQVAAIREAGMRWLGMPQKRIADLKAQDRRDEALASPSRRPLGL
jgi:hypothetical protein